MRAILSSFFLIAVSEMGDKTQLLALSLAARYRRPWVVLAGILTATVANHALASLLGSWVSEHVPPRGMAGGLAVLFVAFALWTLRPDALGDQRGPSRAGPYLTTAVLFFLAEMGDKTQLATAVLAAQATSFLPVWLGSVLGMVCADGLAVVVGYLLGRRLPERPLKIGAAALFLLFGILLLGARTAKGIP
jgi:Ca2+/H+ antiporter, TMEM165/GDT1 family